MARPSGAVSTVLESPDPVDVAGRKYDHQEAAMNRTLCTVTLLLALACLVVPVAEAGGFTVRDVDGPNAFNFDGFVFIGGAAVPAASVGRFIADGRGNLTDGVR